MSRAFRRQHWELTRRRFTELGLLGLLVGSRRWVGAVEPSPRVKPQKAGARREPYFTPPEDFRDVSRGNPIPHSLPEDQKREAGLARDTWRLEIVSDPEHPTNVEREFRKADGTALTFDTLLKLAENKTVRFAKVMTCLNVGCPLGMGLWEGVPLRELLWATKPTENLRRVYYHGFHNADPKQVFRSSLPAGRVLEDLYGLPPVIACFKLNGQWLDSERGGPVRLVVPEAYGFKSVKWLSQVTLSNYPHSNDTYADGNNDVDSPLKTFAATLTVPGAPTANAPIVVTGYAQVGVSGLRQVQVALEPAGARGDEDGTYESAPWVDAELLPAPTDWGLPPDVSPAGAWGFDDKGRPKSWPLRLANAHWTATLPGVPAGDYVLRSRTIDEQGHAQPMPRPFRKSGHAAIESVAITVG